MPRPHERMLVVLALNSWAPLCALRRDWTAQARCAAVVFVCSRETRVPSNRGGGRTQTPGHFRAKTTIAIVFEALAREAAAHAAVVFVRTRRCDTMLGDTRLLLVGLRVCETDVYCSSSSTSSTSGSWSRGIGLLCRAMRSIWHRRPLQQIVWGKIVEFRMGSSFLQFIGQGLRLCGAFQQRYGQVGLVLLTVLARLAATCSVRVVRPLAPDAGCAIYGGGAPENFLEFSEGPHLRSSVYQPHNEYLVQENVDA